MDASAGADIRQRVSKWIEESQALLGLLPGLLEEADPLRNRAQAAEQECERLRRENAALRKEQEDIVGALGKLMSEMLRPMNEMMQKIRGTPKRSPFEREADPESSTESGSAAPSATGKP